MNTENFTGKAEAYVKGRPGYPKEAIEYICSLVPRDVVFADIGAGTGKFTVTLAERGYSVFAVEPNADMRSQLVATLVPFPNIKIMSSTAEATTLPEHSIDVITVAHALHWFNLDAFRAECRRIIKPNGLIIAVYNLTHGGEMINLSKQTTDEFFRKPVIAEFPNPMDYTRDSWLAYIASQDNNPLPSEPGYDAHIAAINAIFDRNSVNGLLHCDRVTKVYSERIV
ncbi:methyltransferase domain-containing protein [Anaerocolumna sedimenticola]|uniref:Methyltransferase domain-containing protein n=1 Tax=Anaerocolumna sedimenticola TaxID=2696063 RepID=A0A6P1TRI1_9FIRM|nr:class I SAM-dependent methyltransferase [Anaerocolumna sedimenticola]QHQ62957.1 methyltransferase domain-containing protein [Anaerocolumna sedimenticola]